ncbi:hypothetical protein QJS83_04995 [Bdellovibrio sp. 22V]|uniref:hypothetical protein n=1 Tax=Bdellovibrio sp. 22V TaxID=3044166 RepID=UPI002543AA3A|nr:hypothetical protein [Bdellovibrio sp. 22V]WII73228.1 hypothetical protein QJS83_04995 [Bdellovibrio sp. 22V]
MNVKLLFVILLGFSAPAYAADFLLSAGYAKGGESLSTATGGQDYRIDAGDGFYLSAGFIFPVSKTFPHYFEIQFTAGVMFTGTEETDEVLWRRLPLEAIYFYKNTDHRYRLGYGAIYHTGNELSANGLSSSASATVDDVWGWTLAAEKIFPPSKEGVDGSLGLRRNFISYSSSHFSKPVQADSWLLTLNLIVDLSR